MGAAAAIGARGVALHLNVGVDLGGVRSCSLSREWQVCSRIC